MKKIVIPRSSILILPKQNLHDDFGYTNPEEIEVNEPDIEKVYKGWEEYKKEKENKRHK